MAYTANVSFGGVSKIEIGEARTHTRPGHSWQSLMLYLYDSDGNLADSVAIHSDDGRTITIDFERKTEAA